MVKLDIKRKPNLCFAQFSPGKRHNERLVNSSGCKIVNMALIFLYKLYKNGEQGWFQNVFSMQLEVLWYKAFFQEKRHCYKKLARRSGEERQKFLVRSTASFRPDAPRTHTEVNGRKGLVFFETT